MLRQTESTTNIDSLASCSASDCSENDGALKEPHIWTRAETMLLINLYNKHVAMFNNPKVTSKQCWITLSKEMENEGYYISPMKCTTKFQCLKRTYKCVSDHNKKSGNNRRKWEYYGMMHEIFGAKPWVKPIAIAGSNVESSSNNSDVENDIPQESVPKKRKISSIVEEYLQRSLKMKEEKERNNQQRHEERMSRLSKIENFMSEIFKR